MLSSSKLMGKYLFASFWHFIAGGKNGPCRQVWHSLSHFQIFFYPTSFPIPDHFTTTKVFCWAPILHYIYPVVPSYYQPVLWLLGHHGFTCKEFCFSDRMLTPLQYFIELDPPNRIALRYMILWKLTIQRHVVFTWYSTTMTHGIHVVFKWQSLAPRFSPSKRNPFLVSVC